VRRGRRQLLLGGAASLFVVPASAQGPADWAAAEPASQGFAAADLDAALAAGAQAAGLRAIAVARNGRLVAERYYGGADGSRPMPVNSATKSVCSLLVGIAVAQGKLGLAQTVGELLPEEAAAFPESPATALTLRQILTGTTGLDYDFTRHTRDLLGAREPVRYVLGLARDGKAPGSWSYNDAAVSLVAPILERAQGLPLSELARRDLFAPLGIGSHEWSRDRAGRATAHMGLQLRPRDLLKVAWLVADGGQWAGARVVPAHWIADSIRPAVGGSWPLPPVTDPGYGYLWFTGTLQGRTIAWAWGYGGQFAMVVPSLRLALATAATSPPPNELVPQTRAIMAVVSRVIAAAA